MKRNIREERFILEYIKNQNGEQAAINAGYSAKSARSQASKLLSKQHIKASIEKRMQEIKDASIVSEQEVMSYLSSILRGNEKETLLSTKGEKVTVPVSAKDRLKSAELIGKYYAMWTDKKDIQATIEPQIVDDVDG
ncbi:terminase small subunit [Apilactobacillus timberlakei]|uniref:terminase small subunit n=1 Tax=Apilactobacillus timberlakei TaxID=2008380 RepID=UPI00112AB221|nr:terminase small subunit [Apilactobacillus timberlakei]TPR21487.1 terminase small subunit [Apilactobacillus timberlakei]